MIQREKESQSQWPTMERRDCFRLTDSSLSSFPELKGTLETAQHGNGAVTCPWSHLTGHYEPFAVHSHEGHRSGESHQALPDSTHGACSNLSLLTEWQGGDRACHLSELGFNSSTAGSPERAAVGGRSAPSNFTA